MRKNSNSFGSVRLHIILTLAIIVFIFIQSALPGDVSGAESNVLVKFFAKLTGLDADVLSIVIRKAAHFTEFAVLGLCLTLNLRDILVIKDRKLNTGKMWPLCWVAGTIYAATDELHQYFVPGREFQVMDICIDSAGVAVGMLVICVILRKELKAVIEFENTRYCIQLQDYFKVLFLKVKLVKRRVCRWRNLLKKDDIVLLLLLTILWIIGIVAFHIFNKEPIKTNALNCMPEYFSSVIIVLVIGLYSRVNEYRKNNRTQEKVYLSCLDTFNSFFDGYYGEKQQYYSPLYCKRTIETTRYFVNNGCNMMTPGDISYLCDITSRKLSFLSELNFQEKIRVYEKWLFDSYIEGCRKALYELDAGGICTRHTMKELLMSSQVLLSALGRIWHEDNDIRKTIYSIVMCNGYDLRDDFYVRMPYYSFEEIIEYAENN